MAAIRAARAAGETIPRRWGNVAYGGLPAVMDGPSFAREGPALWHEAAHAPSADVVREASVRLVDPHGERWGAPGRKVRDLQLARVRLSRLGFFDGVARVEAKLVLARLALHARINGEIAEEYAMRRGAIERATSERKRRVDFRMARAAKRRADTAVIIKQQRKNAEALAVINTIPLLKPSAELEKNELAELLKPVTYDNGEYIIKEGDADAPPLLVIVAQGVCGIVVKGKEVAAPEAPFYVGEGRLISGEPASADVVAKGPVRALTLSAASFRLLASSPTMRYMIPTMRREIAIRDFERTASARGGSLWRQLRHDLRFVKHVKIHGEALHLEVHVVFYMAVERYREAFVAHDPTARSAAHKATTRLVENADHMLCSTPQEKHAMLHLMETIRTVKNADHTDNFNTLKKASERVIEDTIMASFKPSGAYRRFVEDLFPLPATPDPHDEY